MAVFRFREDGGPQRIGPVVGQKEEERSVLVFVDEFFGMPRPEGREVSRFAPPFAVLDDLVVIKAGSVPASFGDPGGKTFLRVKVVAQVPLAD